MKLIENLKKEASKYFAQIDKVAGNLKTLTTSFDAVTGTRKKQLETAFKRIGDQSELNTIETTGTLDELDIQDFGDNEYQDDPVTLVTLGNLKSPIVLLGCFAFVSMIILEKL